MRNKYLVQLFTFSIFASGFSSLIFQDPVPITSAGEAKSAAALAGSDFGFLAGFVVEGNQFVCSDAADGMTWGPLQKVSLLSKSSVGMAASQDVLALAFIDLPLGMLEITALPMNAKTFVKSAATIRSPVALISSSQGFVAGWLDDKDRRPYASFSKDGISWDTTVIDSSWRADSALFLSGTEEGVMAVWKDVDNTPYVSFSSDFGKTWGSAHCVTKGRHIASDVIISGNAFGFMAVWQDRLGNAYASFSNNQGKTWGKPIQFASNVLRQTNAMVSAASLGFAVVWIGEDHNAYGSETYDFGKSWSSPIPITKDGSIVGANLDATPGFVNVLSLEDRYLFAWQDQANNIISRAADMAIEIADHPPSPPKHLNRRSHSLVWQSSPSKSIVAYRVYRDGVQVGNVKGSVWEYEDQHMLQGNFVQYAVTAVDAKGRESRPIQMTMHLP